MNGIGILNYQSEILHGRRFSFYLQLPKQDTIVLPIFLFNRERNQEYATVLQDKSPNSNFIIGIRSIVEPSWEEIRLEIKLLNWLLRAVLDYERLYIFAHFENSKNMANIEITGSPEELERITTFLVNNNVRFRVVKDFANHSLEASTAYSKLLEKFK